MSEIIRELTVTSDCDGMTLTSEITMTLWTEKMELVEVAHAVIPVGGTGGTGGGGKGGIVPGDG